MRSQATIPEDLGAEAMEIEFRCGEFFAVPHTRDEDGSWHSVSAQNTIDALRTNRVRVAPEYSTFLTPYRAFTKSGLPARREVERALEGMAAIAQSGPRLTPEQLPLFEEALEHVTRDEVEAFVGDDRWLRNFVMSIWEFAHGRDTMTTYPWNISLPIADICNARCIFCTSWFEGKALAKVSQLEAFSDVIAHALYVGLVGHGEPMAHPQFDKVCELMERHMDSRATAYTITNGVYLKKWSDLLERINLTSVSISLNAATQATHDAVMGLGDAFPEIIESIERLCRRRDRNVTITMVVTQQNIHEIPEFIELGAKMGVSHVWLRSLLPQSHLQPGLNYHVLPPNLHPDFAHHKQRAIEAIQNAQVPVQADPEMWDKEIFSLQLKEDIVRNPPRMVSREEVLKDKALRKLSDQYYRADARQLRGQALPATEYTELWHRDSRTTVRTRSAPYSVAATFDLSTAPAGGEGQVRVDVSDVSGLIGVGILDKAAHQWVDRVFLKDGGIVTLRYAAPRAELQLVIENGQETQKASSGSFGSVLHQVRHASGAVWSETLPGTAVIVHAPIDPLEDGANPFARMPRFACRAPYYNLYVNEMFYRVVPCCFMTRTPGFEEVRFDGSTPFMEAWNAPGMVELRKRLRDGPLYGACRKCPEKW